VQAQSTAYEASWWTQANPVENAGDYKDRKILGVCDNAVIDNEIPVITELMPADGFQLTDKDSVVISAQAIDNDGEVTTVEFFVDGIFLAADTSSPYSVDWQAVAGSHQISAIATDDQGAQSLQIINTLTVADDVTNYCVSIFWLFTTRYGNLSSG
jgi:chitodextrinase